MSDELVPYALVADDDGLIRMDAATILEDAGFRTFEAANVEEALAILQESGEAVRLLFSDVHMPPSPRTGFELARLCAEQWPHVGIIVSSGAAEPQEGDMPGGACFIRKPFSAELVHNHLQEILPDGAKPEPLRSCAR